MATERQAPDAVISSAGLDVSGGISYIQDDPDSPDGNWFTTDGSDSGSLRVSFPTPTGNPNTGTDLQEFRILVRKSATGGGDPTIDTAELRETGGGAALQTLATSVTVTATGAGTVLSWPWDATNLGTADGSAVELYITFSKGGGGPNERNLEVGAVEWNVDYSTAPGPITGSGSAGLAFGASGAGVVAIMAAGAAALLFAAGGAGTVHVTGSGSGNLSLAAAGAATAPIEGVGAAGLTFGASGAGTVGSSSFATVRSRNASADSTANTSIVCAMPPIVNAGDKLVLMVASNLVTTHTLSGWTQKAQDSPTIWNTTTIFEKTADGTEGGTNVTVTAGASAYGVSASWALANAGSIEYATVAGATANPNPPSLSPSWGSAQNLFIAGCTMYWDNDVTSYPANYTQGQQQINMDASGTMCAASAERELAAASDDPGVFGQSNATRWVAVTMAVQPGGATGVSGSGSAGLSFGASGTGECPIAGSGAAALVLSATGAAESPIVGVGSAGLTFGATGTGTVAVVGTGTAAISLGITGSAAAAVAGSGSAGIALGAAGTGDVPVAGTGSAGLAFAASGAGSVDVAGAGGADLQLAAAGAGSVAVVGSGSAGITFGASGQGVIGAVVTGSGSANLELGASGAGVVTVEGAGSAGLVFAASGVGAVPLKGAGAAGLLFTASGSGTAGSTGAGVAELVLHAAGAGIVDIAGAGQAGLQLGAAGAGTIPVSGSGGAALQFGASGTGSTLTGITGTGSVNLVFATGRPWIAAAEDTARAVARARVLTTAGDRTVTSATSRARTLEAAGTRTTARAIGRTREG